LDNGGDAGGENMPSGTVAPTIGAFWTAFIDSSSRRIFIPAWISLLAPEIVAKNRNLRCWIKMGARKFGCLVWLCRQSGDFYVQRFFIKVILSHCPI
jgi:hypothetical protein